MIRIREKSVSRWREQSEQMAFVRVKWTNAREVHSTEHCTQQAFPNSSCDNDDDDWQATMPHGVCQILYPQLRKAAIGRMDGQGLCLGHMWPYKDAPNQLVINWHHRILPVWRRMREKEWGPGTLSRLTKGGMESTLSWFLSASSC